MCGLAEDPWRSFHVPMLDTSFVLPCRTPMDLVGHIEILSEGEFSLFNLREFI